MKKLAILLLAGAMAGLTSCGNNENTSSKEQIDSMATVRTDTMQAALKAQNDSLINAMAKMRADSAMNATKAVTTTTTTTTTRPATTKTTHTSSSSKPATVHTNNNTAPANNGNTPTITKEQQQQQDNKFNER